MRQYDVYLVCLDPAVGHEIRKARPGIVISPDEMNECLGTVIIAPLTSRSKPYPTRVPCELKGKAGWIVLDQVRALDKRRLTRKLGAAGAETVTLIKSTLKEMLVD